MFKSGVKFLVVVALATAMALLTTACGQSADDQAADDATGAQSQDSESEDPESEDSESEGSDEAADETGSSDADSQTSSTTNTATSSTDDAAPSEESSTTETPTTATTAPKTSTTTEQSVTTMTDPVGDEPDYDPGLKPLVDQARVDLAGRLGLGVEAVSLVLAELRTWPDSSIGCPQKDMQYLQVLTDGAEIIFAAQGSQYRYTTGGEIYTPQLCES